MGTVFAFDMFILFFKSEFQKNLIEKVKLGVKRGYDKSETFFKDIFEKKQILNETAEISRVKVENINYSKAKEKNDFQFKKIEIDLENNT